MLQKSTSARPALGYSRKRTSKTSPAVRLGLLAALMAGGSSPALAESTDAFLRDYSAVLSKTQIARAVSDICNEREAAGKAQRQAALEAWEMANDIDRFDALTAGIARKYPDLRGQLDAVDEEARAQIRPQVASQPEACTEFSEYLSKDEMSLGKDVRRLFLSASQMGITPRRDGETEAGDVIPLARLSANILELMEEAGPALDAQSDRKLRDARNNYAEAWLTAGGTISVFGRVTADIELREWRGDRQSRYSVRCRSFRTEKEETALAAAAGRDAVVAGNVTGFTSSRDDGTITLENCALSPVRLIGMLLTQEGDETGLVARPLDASEVYAGPNGGPSLRSIERVLYDADFSSRMDGFGNGYVDRDEAVYVLLKDGNAFRHEWSFPVTDVDTGTLRRREPGKWFKWQTRGKSITLKPSDGGETIELDEPSELVAIGNNTRLDREYYYLQVAMMGVRTDRGYAFRKNGELDYSRSGFVAGNTGVYYITHVSDANDVKQTGRPYRFEDYALVIGSGENEERKFFAITSDAKRNTPEEVYIGGEVYWQKDRED